MERPSENETNEERWSRMAERSRASLELFKRNPARYMAEKRASVEESERKAKRTKLSVPGSLQVDFSETITVLVGREQQPFVLHKDTIKSSDFLTTGFSGNWQEARDRTITVHDFEPEHFQIYAQWLYTKAFPLMVVGPPAYGKYDQALSERFIFMAELYTMGFFLLDRAFRNAVINDIIMKCELENMYPNGSDTERIWNMTPEDCRLKDLLIDFWARDVRPEVSAYAHKRDSQHTSTGKLPCFCQVGGADLKCADIVSIT